MMKLLIPATMFVAYTSKAVAQGAISFLPMSGHVSDD